MRLNVFAILAALCTLSPSWAGAEQSMTFGDYTVHYSTFTADVLQPDIARKYNITRSQNKGVLNVSVLKSPSTPVKAKVTATATNLSAQLRSVAMREINDQGAIYYLGEFPVNHEETLKFTIKVTPEDGKGPYTATFDQQFFTR